ncbi:MAG: histidine kinase [Microvirga sp.]|jgi:PAS domain S-box-containing protein|nr:histidine kinase [Microvirga sp.]
MRAPRSARPLSAPTRRGRANDGHGRVKLFRLADLAPLLDHYDQLGEVFYALDSEWRIAAANEAALRFAGRTRGEAIGASYWDVVPNARGGPIEGAFGEALATGEVAQLELESSLHPGRYTRLFAIPLQDGLAVGLRDVTEQRSAEAEKTRQLINAEEHLRLAAEAAQIGTWEVDPCTGSRRWSARFRTILGLSEEAQPDPALFSSLIDERDREWVNAMYRGAYEGANGGAYSAEFRIRRVDDGSERWVSTRGRVFFDERGRATRGIGALYDITHRKQAEQALRESEERFRLAAEAFQGGVFDLDATTGHVLRSNRHYEMVGEEPGSIAPDRHAWYARIHPEDRPAFEAAVQGVYEAGARQYEAEYRVRHRDGRWIWIWHRAIALRDEEGRLRRVVGSLIDISERKRAEDALREGEARFRHLADSAPALIWLTDESGRLTFANMHFDFMFGRPAASFVPRGWREIVYPDDLRPFVDRFTAAFKARSAFEMELRVFDRAGQIRWLHADAVPRMNDSGSFLGYTGCAVDITEGKAAQDRQILLIHELNHRVKNTLATVQSIAAQSLRGERSASEARNVFEARLFALSRAHDVLTQESWQGAKLGQIVAQAIEPYGGGHRFRVAGPEVRLSSHSALAFAMALQELATNAAKYGALSVPGGQVEVIWATEPRPSGLLLKFDWAESGGPPVAAPERRGFGTRLIEQSLARDLEAEVTLDFAPGGLTCSISAAVPSS